MKLKLVKCKKCGKIVTRPEEKRRGECISCPTVVRNAFGVNPPVADNLETAVDIGEYGLASAGDNITTTPPPSEYVAAGDSGQQQSGTDTGYRHYHQYPKATANATNREDYSQSPGYASYGGYSPKATSISKDSENAEQYDPGTALPAKGTGGYAQYSRPKNTAISSGMAPMPTDDRLTPAQNRSATSTKKTGATGGYYNPMPSSRQTAPQQSSGATTGSGNYNPLPLAGQAPPTTNRSGSSRLQDMTVYDDSRQYFDDYPGKKEIKASLVDDNDPLAFEKKGIDSGALGGIAMMAIAVIWFVIGLKCGYIFFYPPVLFIVGLISLIKSFF